MQQSNWAVEHTTAGWFRQAAAVMSCTILLSLLLTWRGGGGVEE